MKKRLLIHTLLATCFFALSTPAAWAVLVTWEFNPSGLNQNVGDHTRVYTVPSLGSNHTITARGFDNPPGPDVAHLLYYKSENDIGGASEVGLGLVNTNANELNIDPDGRAPHYIQLDLRAILAPSLNVFSEGEIAVASMQQGEGFRLFGSNVLGSIGTQLPGTWSGLAFDNQFVSIPQFGQFQFISIAAASGRVLPVAFRAELTIVPEMNALFPIVGLLTAVASTQILRRRRAARLGRRS